MTGLFTTFVFSEPLTILLLEALLPIVAYDLFNPPTRSALSDDTPKVKSRTGDPEGAPWWRWWRVCVCMIVYSMCQCASCCESCMGELCVRV